MAPNLIKQSSDSFPTVGSSLFQINGKDLTFNNHVILHDVPTNVFLTPLSKRGSFLGLDSASPSSRHVSPIGRLENIRFTSIFRFKVWWTTLWTGSNGRDLQTETQFLLLNRAHNRPYILLLPIIVGPFRSSLEPHQNDQIALCLESGSSAVTGTHFPTAIYLHAGDDPFQLVKDAISVVKSHLGSFKTMDEKTPPAILDKFGWCTWDAFYLKVSPDGVFAGVNELTAGGCPPGFVLVDDGWQSTDATAEHAVAGEQMPCRLTSYKENKKFDEMSDFVRRLKTEFGTVDYVYVWHALCGYWGGVRPGSEGMPDARLVKPRLSPGVKKTMEDLAVDKIVENGVGLVKPDAAGELYEGMHSMLEAAGIDGVKVDVIHILEMLGEDYGGRVELAKAYYKGLNESIRKHFKGNGVIASMEHCNDFMLLGTEKIALGRVGDDFWCTDPSGDPNGTFWLQGCHMVHCAYNSLWMGNFIRPDWDMFQSTHPCAAFHAASRAISGGPVYISDAVGKHDFELLRRLALPDGTILRCEGYALPTRDCLFEDPLHDGKTVLKIWNLNKYTGVIGAFNCQGGGWSPSERKNKSFAQFSRRLTAKSQPSDIEWTSDIPPTNLFAMYLTRAKTLLLLNPNKSFEISLDPFDYELVVVSPVTEIKNVKFAPIGLTNMLNCGGAIREMEVGMSGVSVSVRGGGEFVAYSSGKPVACRVDGKEKGFVYEEEMVMVEVEWSGSFEKFSVVELFY